MRIAVVGGTGLSGRHVIEALQATGVDTVPLSRGGGVDVTTGAGLDGALSGVQRVIDATNVATQDEAVARAFFTAAGEQLQRAGEAAGVERLVVLSIVGVDRIGSGYTAAKLDHEEVRAAPNDSPDGRAAASGALLAGPDATIAGPTFDQWLEAGEREP